MSLLRMNDRCVVTASTLAALLLFGPQGAAAEPPNAFELTLDSDQGTLLFEVPAGWTPEADKEGSSTVSFVSSRDQEFVVLVSVIAATGGHSIATDEIRGLAQGMGEAQLATALQTRIELREIKGEQARGFLFHLTDRKPEKGPGDFREVNSGPVIIGPCLASVTILRHSGDEATLEAAVAMIASARHRPKEAAQSGGEGDSGTRRLGLAGKSWALVVDLPGFELVDSGSRPDGSGTMIHLARGELNVSATLERRPDLLSTEACRADYWKEAAKSPLPKSDIRQLTAGALATVHWFVLEFQGASVRQKHVNAYLFRDGVCIDLHLSKVHHEAEDDKLFTAILGSVRFSDT